MDYAAHGFWSYIIFNWIPKPLYAVLFGLMPDTLSWFIYAVYRIATKGYFGKPVLAEIPGWAFTLYDISHSLVVASAIILLIFIVLRRVPVYVFAWPIAITMDVFTHSRKFLPTPFLWPISEWRFPGISWGTRWFMALNYAAITAALIFIIFKRRRQRSSTALSSGRPAER